MGGRTLMMGRTPWERLMMGRGRKDRGARGRHWGLYGLVLVLYMGLCLWLWMYEYQR